MRLFPSLKIAQKLPLALVGSAIVVGLGIGLASYFFASSALEGQARQNLTTLAFERSNQLATYLASVEDNLRGISQSESTIQAVRDFSGAFLQMNGQDPTTTLQQLYLKDNPNKPEERLNLDTPTTATTLNYATVHTHYQPIFRSLIQGEGYKDLYLFDLTGKLIYSTGKQDDFATNFADGAGPFAATGLGNAFRKAVAVDQPNDFVFDDFGTYPALPGQPLAFFAKPVFNATGRKVGVVAFAFTDERLSGIIQARTGLGQTGDITVVGPDGLARSDSALTSEPDLMKPALFDGVVKNAVDGVPGETETGFRGSDVIAAAAPVDVTASQGWALVASMNKNEVLAPVTQLTISMGTVGVTLLAIVAVVGWIFARTITVPLARLAASTNALAEGDLDVEVSGQGRADEIGTMAKAVEVFRDNAHRIRHMAEDERSGSEQRRVDRAKMMRDLQRAFGEVVDAATRGDFSKRVRTEFPDAELNGLARSVNNLVETVERGIDATGEVLSAMAQADLTQRVQGDFQGAFGRLRDDTNRVCETLGEVMRDLGGTSRSLKTATREILDGANDLSERTTRQSATLEETSAAMEQLANTVRENATRAQAASAKARAVSQAATEGGVVMDRANDAMSRITASSGKISNIIGLIDDIAFQTNLLALNASVEAARAGEAGKGFAVVAVEVRRLAQSAAQASAEIKVLIEQSGGEVSGGSRLVAEAAQKLVLMLQSARESSLLIDGIASSSQEQAMSIDEVTSSVRQLDEMTQHNAALVEETNAAIEQTEAQASELDRIVDGFIVEAESTPRVRSMAA